MVSQPQIGLARSFSCGTCATLCGRAVVYPDDSATFPIGFTGDLGDVGFQQCLATCGQCGSTVQGPLDETPTWSSLNTSIASVHSGTHSTTASFIGVTSGSTTGSVTASDEGCTARGSGPLTVTPKITGPNTVWWFNGETPTGYATSITLTASGGTGYSWSISKGSSMIHLSATTGSSVTASSTGTAFSSTNTDIAITVTDTTSGKTSSPFNITSRRPYLLIVGTITDACAPPYGYGDNFDYTIEDQMGAPMPTSVPFNEYWTTAVMNDYPNTNWARYNPGYGFTTSDEPAQFTDQVQGAPSGSIPPVACPGAAQAVDHWGQEWFIGALIPGVGVAVQKDTIKKYTNHAEIQAITSPVP